MGLANEEIAGASEGRKPVAVPGLAITSPITRGQCDTPPGGKLRRGGTTFRTALPSAVGHHHPQLHGAGGFVS